MCIPWCGGSVGVLLVAVMDSRANDRNRTARVQSVAQPDYLIDYCIKNGSESKVKPMNTATVVNRTAEEAGNRAARARLLQQEARRRREARNAEMRVRQPARD